ncbi:hypothetical protein AB0395_10655 [Streptosporangium sp. NPDC051023]|uniref:hypothetical protein n=1 Tax=Streptosporangium sp. NPDC051023 TaxID=3155410 RepID=UPI00344E96DC
MIIVGYVLAFLVTVAVMLVSAAWAVVARPLRRAVPYLGLLAVALGAGWWTTGVRLAGNACASRQDLNVITMPDEEGLIRALAAEFGQESPKACAITVVVSSFDGWEKVQANLSSSWYPSSAKNSHGFRLIPSPRPDMLVLDSPDQVKRILERPGRALLTDEGSLGTSPVVLAVPADSVEELQNDGIGNGRQPVGQLVESVTGKGLTVVRPFPESSHAGMLATFALYQGKNARELEKTEESVTPSSGKIPLRSSLAAMCVSVNSKSVGEDAVNKLAVIAPLYAVNIYNEAIPISGNPENNSSSPCPAIRMTARTPSFFPVELPDVSQTNIPVIRVRWPGGAGRDHDAAIDVFLGWLREKYATKVSTSQFPVSAFPTTAAPEPSPDAKVDQYYSARTSVDAVVLIDVSGSMNKYTSRGGSSLNRAKRLALELDDRLSGHDHLGLSVFPRNGGGNPPAAVGRDTFPGEIDRLEANGRSSEIFRAARDAVYDEKRKGKTIILITDADSRGPFTAENLRSELRKMGMKLYILPVGPYDCTAPELRPLKERCIEGIARDDDATVIDKLMRSLRVRSSS